MCSTLNKVSQPTANGACAGKLSGTHSCCGDGHAYTVNSSPEEPPAATAAAAAPPAAAAAAALPPAATATAAAPPAAAAAAADPPALGNVLSFGLAEHAETVCKATVQPSSG